MRVPPGSTTVHAKTIENQDFSRPLERVNVLEAVSCLPVDSFDNNQDFLPWSVCTGLTLDHSTSENLLKMCHILMEDEQDVLENEYDRLRKREKKSCS